MRYMVVILRFSMLRVLGVAHLKGGKCSSGEKSRMRTICALASLVLVLGALGQSSENCIWIEPGSSIQTAIDLAPPGSTLCLPEGTWTEDLVIDKSLTLRGQGPGRSVIQAKTVLGPVLRVRGSEKDRPIVVFIEDVTILGRAAEIWDEIEYVARANVGVFGSGTAYVVLRNCVFLETLNSIWLTDRVQALITSIAIYCNTDAKPAMLDGTGIILTGQAQAAILETTIVGVADAIVLDDSAQASIERVNISKALFGVFAQSMAQATIAHTSITQTEDAIVLRHNSQV